MSAVKFCLLCQQKVPLYKCSVCGLTGHVDVKNKTVTLHPPPLDPKKFKKQMQTTVSYPSHFDCELAKPINLINLDKLVKVNT